ncbi:MAG TPA: AraC family transcriptional regulator [Clostridia bacterium]
MEQLDLSKFTDLSLQECGREKCIATKDIVFTAKPYHLFHYVLAGKGYFHLDGNAYELKRGQIFYIPPMLRPKYYPDRTDPWTYTWIAFDGLYADRLLKLCDISREKPIFSDTKDYKLFKYFIEISDIYQQKGYLDIKCLGLMYELFAEMMAMNKSLTNYTLTAKEGHIKQAKEFIMYNYQFNITIKDIADSLNITSNYLANIFNEVLGCSPKAWLTKYRMEKACSLLRTGEYSIGKVANMVGYKNQLHFATEFKKHFKMTPTEYQKSLRKEIIN